MPLLSGNGPKKPFIVTSVVCLLIVGVVGVSYSFPDKTTSSEGDNGSETRGNEFTRINEGIASQKVPKSKDDGVKVRDIEPDSGVTESSVSKDEQISKLWFDLRQGGSDGKSVDSLILKIQQFMEENRVPQIIDKFPLQMVSYEDYGFQEDLLSTSEGMVHLITAVFPTSVSREKRVVVFVRNNSGKSTYVSVWKGLGVIPTSIGVTRTVSGSNFLVSGNVLDKEIFSDDATLGVYGIKEKDSQLILQNLKMPGKLFGVVANVRGNVIEFKRDNISVSPFFYNEIVDEGEASDDLQLVVQNINDSQAQMFVFRLLDSGLEIRRQGGGQNE